MLSLLLHAKLLALEGALTLACTVVFLWISGVYLNFTILSRKLLHIGMAYVISKNVVNVIIANRVQVMRGFCSPEPLEARFEETKMQGQEEDILSKTDQIILVSASFLGLVSELTLLFLWCDTFQSLI